MVWRNRHRTGRKKRAKLEKLRKASVSIITWIQIRQFLSPQARRQLKGTHLCQKYRGSSDRPFHRPPTTQPIVPLVIPPDPPLDFEFLSPCYSPILDNFQNSELSAPSHSLSPSGRQHILWWDIPITGTSHRTYMKFLFCPLIHKHTHIQKPIIFFSRIDFCKNNTYITHTVIVTCKVYIWSHIYMYIYICIFIYEYLNKVSVYNDIHLN